MAVASSRSATFAFVIGLAAACGGASGEDRAFQAASALCTASARGHDTAAKGVLHGVGVVKAIDAATGWLTLDHEEIKGFMDAMEMMYTAEPRDLGFGLRVGDRVAFDIDPERIAIVGVRIVEPAK